MADEGFVIEGLDEYYKGLLKLAQEQFPDAIEAYVSVYGMQFMKRVAELSPTDTNRLRNSFIASGEGIDGDDSVFQATSASDGAECVCGSNVEYADYVNTGHELRNEEWWEGLHYFDDAYEEMKEQFPDWLAERLDELFDKFGG